MKNKTRKLIIPEKVEVKYSGEYNKDFNTAVELALSYFDLTPVGAKGSPDGTILMFEYIFN